MFFRSIRFKVLLWYMAILTTTLLIFSGILYGVFDKFLIDSLDDLICSGAEGLANSIEAYWVSPQGGKNIEAEPSADNLKNFEMIGRDWVEEKRKDPELMKVFVQILNTSNAAVNLSDLAIRYWYTNQPVAGQNFWIDWARRRTESW